MSETGQRLIENDSGNGGIRKIRRKFTKKNVRERKTCKTSGNIKSPVGLIWE